MKMVLRVILGVVIVGMMSIPAQAQGAVPYNDPRAAAIREDMKSLQAEMAKLKPEMEEAQAKMKAVMEKMKPLEEKLMEDAKQLNLLYMGNLQDLPKK